jgi:hypothetical protein
MAVMRLLLVLLLLLLLCCTQYTVQLLLDRCIQNPFDLLWDTSCIITTLSLLQHPQLLLLLLLLLLALLELLLCHKVLCCLLQLPCNSVSQCTCVLLVQASCDDQVCLHASPAPAHHTAPQNEQQM